MNFELREVVEGLLAIWVFALAIAPALPFGLLSGKLSGVVSIVGETFWGELGDALLKWSLFRFSYFPGCIFRGRCAGWPGTEGRPCKAEAVFH